MPLSHDEVRSAKKKNVPECVGLALFVSDNHGHPTVDPLFSCGRPMRVFGSLEEMPSTRRTGQRFSWPSMDMKISASAGG